MTHFSILSIHCVYDIQTSILPHTNMCKKQALIQLYRCFDVNELFSEIISCCLILEKNEIIFLTFFYQLSIPRSLSLFLPRSFPFFPAWDSVFQLMGHQVRATQQEQQKRKYIGALDESTPFLTVDRSQKILPQQFREGQSSYFGKKGMNLLVGTFIVKVPPQGEKSITVL